MRGADPMIKVDVSSKVFRQAHDSPPLDVLRDIRFDIDPGEFCCIVGPSGCGKTTLLNLISGLDEAFDGSVTIAGGPLAAGPSPGYMFQSSRLMP